MEDAGPVSRGSVLRDGREKPQPQLLGADREPLLLLPSGLVQGPAVYEALGERSSPTADSVRLPCHLAAAKSLEGNLLYLLLKPWLFTLT